MPRSFKNTRLAPQDLESGAVLGPNESVEEDGLTLGVEGGHDQGLVDESVLVEVQDKPTKAQLEAAKQAAAGEGEDDEEGST